MAFQKVEFEFPHESESGKDEVEIEIEPSSATVVGQETKVESEADNSEDYELEVVDDTPEADRGRTPSEPPAEVTEDELQEYSEKVRRRIQHFSKGYHDERRAKETALREREELERMTQQLLNENKELKGNVTKNQTALLEQARKTAEFELDSAKQAYKDAYEGGDSDAVVAAQDTLTTAKIKADKLTNFKVPALQEEETPVQSETTTPPPNVDPRLVAWQERNPWFNKDTEMTGFAMAVHTKLVNEDGVNPVSDEYYERLDARMRSTFPENFEGDEEVRKPKKRSNVVAPATRSTTPKRIRLTQTQLTLAKRLGLTPEQYAKQVAIDMGKQNG